MMRVEDMLDCAIEKDASDIHLINGLQPMLRIRRDLIPIEDSEILTENCP